ncbi:MAG: hypothetical protein WBJ03_02170, partial [Moraxellaceae bacterium]
MRNKILAVAMAVAGVAFSGASVAATQGTVGGTSSGSVVINATIPKLIRITDLANITVDVAAATATIVDATGYAADATGFSDACVRQNGATATYGIKATSLNGSFVLKSGTLTVPYTLSWGVTDLTYNTALTTQTPDSTSLGSCTPVTDKLGVKITAANLNTA